MRTSGRIIRLGVTALCTDFAIYLLWVAIPYKAIALGASAIYLGILPTVSSITYAITTLVAGRLADRHSRIRLARFGAIFFVAGCLLVMQARSLVALLALVPLMSVGIGFFWAPLQAALADEARLSALERNVGFLNVCWSVGKALGFLIGGALYTFFGADPSFLLAAGLLVLVAIILPAARSAPGRSESESSESLRDLTPRITPAQLRAFLVMAWIANALGFGVGNTLNMQYPKFLMQFGWGADSFGVYLGIIFAVQTLAFILLRRIGGWKFRRLPLFVIQAGMAVAIGVLPFLRAFPLILLTALPIGVAVGFAYHASITYSLIDHATRGRRAGIHEALVGVGNFSLPLIGGLIATGIGDLRAPYWVCTVIVLLALSVQQMLWRRSHSAAA